MKKILTKHKQVARNYWDKCKKIQTDSNFKGGKATPAFHTHQDFGSIYIYIHIYIYIWSPPPCSCLPFFFVLLQLLLCYCRSCSHFQRHFQWQPQPLPLHRPCPWHFLSCHPHDPPWTLSNSLYPHPPRPSRSKMVLIIARGWLICSNLFQLGKSLPT